MQKRDVIRFEPGEAVTVELKYQTGRAVSGTHGPQMMYTTTDDRVFFLEPQIADSLEALHLRKGERVRIAKLRQGDGIHWDMERVPSQQDARPVHQNGISSQDSPGSSPESVMADCFRAALDAIADAQEYSNRKALGIAFTSDNVTSAALSAYIAKSREGKAA